MGIFIVVICQLDSLFLISTYTYISLTLLSATVSPSPAAYIFQIHQLTHIYSISLPFF